MRKVFPRIFEIDSSALAAELIKLPVGAIVCCGLDDEVVEFKKTDNTILCTEYYWDTEDSSTIMLENDYQKDYVKIKEVIMEFQSHT